MSLQVKVFSGSSICWRSPTFCYYYVLQMSRREWGGREQEEERKNNVSKLMMHIINYYSPHVPTLERPPNNHHATVNIQ
nr:uncharacterized protein LOC129136997 isoform X2 [Pan troglodytes]